MLTGFVPEICDFYILMPEWQVHSLFAKFSILLKAKLKRWS